MKISCRLCHDESCYIFSANIFGKEIKYYSCENCSYLQTEDPYWLDQAYENSINKYDTGIIQRNLHFQKITSTLIKLKFDKKGKFLDAAGGYGIFVRLMRDIGYDFYWQDLYSNNLLAMGFEACNIDEKYEMVTCFEAFEHFVYPLVEIEKLLSYSKNILFSTELVSEPAPKPKDWLYYGTEHGQHIGFLNEKSLRFIAKHFNQNIYSHGDFIHLLTNKDISELEFKVLVKTSRLLYPFMKQASLTIDDKNILK